MPWIYNASIPRLLNTSFLQPLFLTCVATTFTRNTDRFSYAHRYIQYLIWTMPRGFNPESYRPCDTVECVSTMRRTLPSQHIFDRASMPISIIHLFFHQTLYQMGHVYSCSEGRRIYTCIVEYSSPAARERAALQQRRDPGYPDDSGAHQGETEEMENILYQLSNPSVDCTTHLQEQVPCHIGVSINGMGFPMQDPALRIILI